MAENRAGFRFSIRGLLAFFVVLGLVLAAVAALRRAAISEKGPRRPFEPSLWTTAAPTRPCQPTVRSEMVEHLLEHYDFSGWSRAEVVELLGPPKDSVAGTGFEQWDLIYVLGLERTGAYSLDDEALGFKFDNAGKVVEFGTSVN